MKPAFFVSDWSVISRVDGELVAGKKKGRTNETEITVFKSVGLAIQDVATASKVLELARAKGIGKIIEI